uniref:Tudor domain-containing protein n=2 Tax=Cuerna arida TaxID=1464854 RepID=A0A1B6GXP9_9HEMI
MEDTSSRNHELQEHQKKFVDETDKLISHLHTFKTKVTVAIARAESVVSPSIKKKRLEETKDFISRLIERLVDINCEFELDDGIPSLSIPYPPVGNRFVQLQFLAGDSPWNFWLCDKLVDTKVLHKTLLQKYQNDLLEHCQNPKPSESVCFFDRNRIFRGIILQTINECRVKVLDCDSNITKVVTTDRVFRPDPDACAVHAYALRCTIVKEKDSKQVWSTDLRDLFCNTLKEAVLYVKLLEKLPGTFPNFLVDVEMHFEEERGNLKEWLIDRLLPELRKLNTDEHDENESICDFLSAESLNPYYKSSIVNDDKDNVTEDTDRNANELRVPQNDINNLNLNTNKVSTNIHTNVNHSEDEISVTPEANDQVSSSCDAASILSTTKCNEIISIDSTNSQFGVNSDSSKCVKKMLDIRLDGASEEFKPMVTKQNNKRPPRFNKAHNAIFPPQVNNFHQPPGFHSYAQHSAAFCSPSIYPIASPWAYQGQSLQQTPSWPRPSSFNPWQPPSNGPSLPPVVTEPTQKSWSSGEYSNCNTDGNDENVKIENINNISVNVNVLAPEFVPRQSNDNMKYSSKQNTSSHVNGDRPSILPVPDTTTHLELRKPSTLFKPGENLLVMIAHVQSPAEFYVHFLTSNNRLIDKLRDDMFQHYNLKDPVVYNSWQEARHALGKFCACKWREDKHWYRVEVIDSTVEEDHLKVFFVDYGNTECVHFNCLQPLFRGFEKLPMCAQRCHLAKIHPLIKGGPWSRESIDFFKSKVEETNKHVYSITVVPSNDNQIISNSLSVMLFEGKATDDSSSINDQMVDQGLAWSRRLLTQTVLSNGSDIFQSQDELSVLNEITNVNAAKESLETFSLDFDLNVDLPETTRTRIDENWDDWDPRKEDFYSARNNPALDTDDACVAVSGYSARDEKRVCKFYARKGFCWKKNCPKEHFKPNKDGVTTDKEEVYSRAFTEMSLPAVGEEISVRVTAVESLSYFYVQLREDEAVSIDADNDEDEETLTSLHEYMNLPENIERMRYLAVPPALGQLVIAKCEGKWFRARVISADDNPEVMFVDYGSTATVDAVDLRHMEPQYLHLPFQAIECSLANVIPPDNSELFKKGTEQLKDLILDNILTAKIYDAEEVTDDVHRLQILLQLDSGIDVGEWLVGSNVCKLQLCLPILD